MKRQLVAAVVAALAVFVALPDRPAGAAAEALAIALDTSSFPDVVATITVPDSLAETDVAADAVRVAEDGERRRATVEASRSRAVPVIVVVDTSGSMAGAPMDQARAAATDFVRRLPAAWPVGVIGFGPRPGLLSPLTTDRAAVEAAVGSLEARGETALFDAVALAGEHLRTGAIEDATVVLLSDGGDTVSTTDLDGALAQVAPGVRLEIVELTSTESNHDALVRLAAARRGRVTSVGDAAGLGAVYDGLVRSLTSEYTVSFRSTATESSTIAITVSAGALTAAGSTTLDVPAGARPAPVTTVAPAPETANHAAATTTAEDSAVRGWLLLAGAACVFLAIAVGSLMVSLPNRRFAVLQAIGWRKVRRQSDTLAGLASRAVAAADSALEQHGKRGRLNELLEQAGVDLRAGELLTLAASASFAAGVLGALFAGPLLGLVAAVMVVAGFRMVLGVRVAQRQRQFANQLPDTVQMLAGGLRAGYALNQAIDSVAKEAPAPTSEELHRIVVETRLGRDLTDSLRSAAQRLGGNDFDWVVQAIEIQRDVGGDLAEVLDNVGVTIRERTQLQRHVRALTAEGRLSAYVLLGLPVVLAFAMSFINPGYLSELTHGIGLALAVTGVVLEVVGALWFKSLCRLQV